MSASPVRVALFSTVQLNPYVSLLAAGVRAAAPAISTTEFERLTLGWCLHESSRYDIIHVHWAELQYRDPVRWRRFRRFVSFITALALARQRGMRLAYTLHNLAQHEGRDARLNGWANSVLFALSDAVHVHDDSVAQAAVSAGVPAARLWTIPHGSYVGCYPNAIGRAEACRHLGLSTSDRVLLSLGGLRPYKGIEELILAFRNVERADVRLVIAGHAHELAYATTLQELASGDDRVQIHAQHVPDDQLQYFMYAADACVLPYRHVTTSGSAVLALSFGRPIIAPAVGPFPALIGAAGGLLYDPVDTQGLFRSLEDALGRDWSDTAVLRESYLDSIAWPNVGRRHAEMYRAIAGDGRPGVRPGHA